jgi:hypothetical protein
MPTTDLVQIVKMGLKLVLFSLLLGVIATFINFIIGLIPPINIGGCMGYYFNRLGIFDGFSIMLSIVVYGFAVKFGISYFSNYLN